MVLVRLKSDASETSSGKEVYFKSMVIMLYKNESKLQFNYLEISIYINLFVLN